MSSKTSPRGSKPSRSGKAPATDPGSVEALRARKHDLLIKTNPRTREPGLTKAQINDLYNQLVEAEADLVEAITIKSGVSIKKVTYARK